METKAINPQEWKTFTPALVSEFLGTVFVVVTIYFNSLSGFSHFDYSYAYLVGYIVVSTISGAHFNPAISFAIYLYEGKFKEYRNYIIAVVVTQLCGSLTGILLTHIVRKGAGTNMLRYFLIPEYSD